MKRKASKILEIIIHSINSILISYALSNVAMLLKASQIFILFFEMEKRHFHIYIWIDNYYIVKDRRWYLVKIPTLPPIDV